MTIPFDGGQLRPTSAADVDMLQAFFADPAVNEHWGGEPLGAQEIQAKYTGARSPDVECFIVEAAGVDCGLVQYHIADDGGGIDLVLLPSARSAGLGTLVVQALVGFLRNQLQWQRITVDPDVANVRGVSFWSRVGFEPLEQVDDDPDRDPYWLMTWPPNG